METKRQFYDIADLDLYGSKIYGMDLTQYIQQGTGEINRIGDTITNVFARVSATWSWTGLQSGTTRIWQGGNVRLMLVKTPQALTGLSINVLSDITSQVSDMFLNQVQTVNSFHDVTSPFKILAQKWIHSAQTTDVSGNAGDTHMGFLSKQLTKKHQYLDGSGNQTGRTYNYYLFATSSAPLAGSSDLLGKLQTSAVVSYKDA